MSSGHLVPLPPPDGRGQQLGEVAHVLYQVNHMLPDDQTMVTVSPDTIARDALRLMKQHGYSQLPVMQQGAVVGVFSHRSFAEGVLDLAGEGNLRAEQLPVIDFVEQLRFTDVTTDIGEILMQLDADNAVLVGNGRRLVGLATPMDALRFFYRVASAFLLIQEIERAIRILLQVALTDDELAVAMARSRLGALGDASAPPAALEDLSFGDYVQLIGNRENWVYLEPFFGTSRALVMAKLKPVNRLRNDAFHFRRDLTEGDYERLSGVRAWLRIRLMLSPVGDGTS